MHRARMLIVITTTVLAAALAWGQDGAEPTNRLELSVDPAMRSDAEQTVEDQERPAEHGQFERSTSAAARGPLLRHANFIDADLAQIASYLGQETHRRFVIGRGVCAQISATWRDPMSDEDLYGEFLSIVRSLGFVILEQDSVTHITLDENTADRSVAKCRQYPGAPGEKPEGARQMSDSPR